MSRVKRYGRKRKAWRGVLAATGLAAALYVGGIAFFHTHFYPNTKVGSIDIGFRSGEGAKAYVKEELGRYSLTILEKEGEESVSAADAGLSFTDLDKVDLIDVAKAFSDLGYKILATGGTYQMITEAGIKAEKVKKLYEGRPNIGDMITNGDIDLVINTPAGKTSAHDDSYIRKDAIKQHVPYITTMAAAKASAEGIKAARERSFEVKALQDFHAEIK